MTDTRAFFQNDLK